MKKIDLNEISLKLYIQLHSFLADREGDMAEKAAVWAVILLVAIGAFMLLGKRIAALVTAVAAKIAGD
jgi:hypothetical protein